MVSITFPLEESTMKAIDQFQWVSWSEIVREEIVKKEMLERYIKTGKITDADWEFCESIDWHPVDELPYKKSFIKKLEKARKGPFIKLNSVDELFKK
jgi:hypothetical protein